MNILLIIIIILVTSITHEYATATAVYSVLARKAFHIFTDPIYPPNLAFQKLPSGRCIIVPLARKNVYKKSFVSTAVAFLNVALN